MLAALPPTLDKPGWRALASAFGRQFQAIEDAAIATIAQRSLSRAEGAQLDILGKLVRQARGGRGDDDYRRVIGCKIAVNGSQGSREDLIRVARLALLDPSVRVRLETSAAPGAEQAMTLEGIVADAAATDVVLFAQLAAKAGVRVIVESWPVPEDELLRLDDPTPGAGFAVPPTLDLGSLTTFDTIIAIDPDYARDNAGDVFTMEFVEDVAAPDVGELDDSTYPDFVFRFRGGVTTIADCEARLVGSHYFFIAQAASAPAAMNDSDDDFPAQPFAAAVAGGAFATSQDGRETYPTSMV
jgi:hypothetical protein